MFNQIVSLILLTVISYPCCGEMPDPTKPVYPENTKVTAINFEGEPKLTAIWISAKSRWATINGIRAKQGQMIPGNIRIFKINRHSVTISQNGDVKTLQLLK